MPMGGRRWSRSSRREFRGRGGACRGRAAAAPAPDTACCASRAHSRLSAPNGGQVDGAPVQLHSRAHATAGQEHRYRCANLRPVDMLRGDLALEDQSWSEPSLLLLPVRWTSEWCAPMYCTAAARASASQERRSAGDSRPGAALSSEVEARSRRVEVKKPETTVTGMQRKLSASLAQRAVGGRFGSRPEAGQPARPHAPAQSPASTSSAPARWAHGM